MTQFFIATYENRKNSARKGIDDHRDDITRQQRQQPAVKQIMAGNEGGKIGGISVGRFTVPGGEEVCPAAHDLSEKIPAGIPR